LIDLVKIISGLVLLYYGGNFLVTGSVRLAYFLKISLFLVGSTVIAFGTSMPELAVSLLAAIDGTPELAMGNIIGSNVANICLVLGLTALICTISIQPNSLKRESPPLLFASTLILVLAWDMQINRYEGIFMSSLLSLYIWRSFSHKEDYSQAPDEDTNLFAERGPVFQIFLIVLGFISLVGGAKFLVQGGTSIALKYGVSEWFIGITIVAIGTSLPEIVSSLIAAKRGYAEMAIGNIFGSNIFNILMVLGLTSTIQPLSIKEPIQSDLIIVTTITWFLVAMIKYGNHSIGKQKSILLLLAYFLYIGLKGTGNL